ncbi:ribonuclease E/G [Candidatus Williamhamiltonella defendens]|nr:ribonuclease G [Candidatus Hamiltonella defensa]AYB49356.1 ribonuclease E/G [Candidatus Hamiltonella defensa]
MTSELLINVTPFETRVAYIDDNILQEIYIERENENKTGLVGNIYQGRVTRILPGMQAAFIDIQLEKAAFLHASDILSLKPPENEDQRQDIAELIHLGQNVMVQVIKDPLGSKGARLTTHITLASRYLVLTMTPAVGISQRLENEQERERLKNIVSSYCDKKNGFIVRTAAEGMDEKALASDAAFLKSLWANIIAGKTQNGSKNVLYTEIPLKKRILRDFTVVASLDRVRIDDQQTYNSLKAFSEEYIPEMLPKLEHYPVEKKNNQPLFSFYHVENEIQSLLNKKVPLKSGGCLIIEQTEAMTTIDINTAGFVGYKNLEETIFDTNIEATRVIARQLRLRNLGGIIIIDFIDMKNEGHKKNVLSSLKKALNQDRVKTTVGEFSPLGLIEITRKRTTENIEKILCDRCQTCEGRGWFKSPETVCHEIFRKMIQLHHSSDSQQMLVYVSNRVSDFLLHQKAETLAKIQCLLGKKIQIKIDPLYTQNQFHILTISPPSV